MTGLQAKCACFAWRLGLELVLLPESWSGSWIGFATGNLRKTITITVMTENARRERK